MRCVGAEYGPDTFDPFKTLEAFTGGPIDWEAVQTRRRTREAALLAALAPLPGVEALIAEARVRRAEAGDWLQLAA